MRNLPSGWLVIMCLAIIQIELEFGNVGFYEGRKTGVPGEKPSEQRREPTTHKLNPHMTPGIEPGPHFSQYLKGYSSPQNNISNTDSL